MGSHSDVNSFYSAAFQHAYTKFTDCLNTIAINKKLDKDDCSVLGYMRRKSERKSSLTFKSLARCADKASLASYIRLFEPMVIKSLKVGCTTFKFRKDSNCLVLTKGFFIIL